MAFNKKIFANRLKSLMDERGLTQTKFPDEFEKKMGRRINRESINKYINEKISTAPKQETLQDLANFFRVDIGYLTGEQQFKSWADKFDHEHPELIKEIQVGMGFLTYIEENLHCDLTEIYEYYSDDDVEDFFREIDEFIIFKYNRMIKNKENAN